MLKYTLAFKLIKGKIRAFFQKNSYNFTEFIFYEFLCSGANTKLKNNKNLTPWKLPAVRNKPEVKNSLSFKNRLFTLSLEHKTGIIFNTFNLINLIKIFNSSLYK